MKTYYISIEGLDFKISFIEINISTNELWQKVVFFILFKEVNNNNNLIHPLLYYEMKKVKNLKRKIKKFGYSILVLLVESLFRRFF